MATTTTNLGLTKPSGTDKIRIAQINGNMDILDDKIGAVGNTSLQAQVTSANEAISNIASPTNYTNDILADALNVQGTKVFSGSGSVYTGTVPDNVYKYGVFTVYKRYSTYMVVAVGDNNHVAVNSYNTVWSGWQELALNSNTLKKTSLKITSGNLDDYYGDDKAGLYYVGSGVTNSELDYSGLIVIAQESYGAQIQFNYRSVVIRTRTGNPATWSNWTYLTQSLANGYVGASQTKTYALSARITYILTISNIASNNVENIYTAMVVAPPSSSNTGKIVWLTSTPPNSVTVSLSGFTLTVASSSSIWINVALTRM